MALRTNNIPANIDLAVAQSQMTLVETRESSVWKGLCNTRWESDLQGRGSVSIPIPNTNMSTDESENRRARGGDWVDASDVSQANVVFSINRGHTESKEILWEDADEASWRRLVSHTRSQIAPILRKRMDNEIGAGVKGATYAAAPANRTQGRLLRVGESTAFTALDSDAAKRLVREGLDEGYLNFFERDKIDYERVLGGVGELWTVMRPRTFLRLRQDSDNRNYHWDQLTRELLTANSILSNRAYRATLNGIRILSTNDIPEPASGEREYMLMGTPDAITMAMKTGITQSFSPEQNQISSKPAFLFRQATRFDYMILQANDFLLKIEMGGAKA